MAETWIRPGPGERVRLAAIPTASEGGEAREREAEARVRDLAGRMVRLQDFLMAHGRHGVLILFQGMDASGKDEAIRDVLSWFDPRSTEFKQFKHATEKEIRHDYLWRAVAAMPARGQVGIFNRSYYEHVVAERVHPEVVEKQRLPEAAREDLWTKRFRQIADFERYLEENGIHVLKFFLHVSREEQRRRLLERIADPETRWDFSPADVAERQHWDEYMHAYDEAMTHTNTAHAPWHVVPADSRIVAQEAVATVVVELLAGLHDGYPEPDGEEAEELERARERLESEAPAPA